MVVPAHPVRASLTGTLADASCEALAADGHAVQFHDLDAEGFEPRIAPEELTARRSNDALIERHCGELAAADGIVIVRPNWWSQPPAILKGWLDRVVRPGVAYDFRRDESGRMMPVGLLRARTAVVINTANVPQAALGDSLETLRRKAVFERCGVRDVRRAVFAPAQAGSPQQRAAWCGDVGALVRAAFAPS